MEKETTNTTVEMLGFTIYEKDVPALHITWRTDDIYLVFRQSSYALKSL